MHETLRLADARILLALNHALAAHPKLYIAGLWITDTFGDVAFFLTCALLWFWHPRIARALAPEREEMTLVESRARLITLGVAGVSAYVLTRLIAMHFDVDRPFATFLPVHSVIGAFEGLRTFGSFPSDHAALLGVLPVGFAWWGRRLAWSWLALASLFAATRVAVAFHYPTDMLVGTLIGCAAAWVAMTAFDMVKAVQWTSRTLATGFSRPPISYALYGVLVLGGAEFAMHFRHLLTVILLVKQRFS
jgi:membrane-associated phospholipid phosphatase